jgi:hypothetical protein
VTAVCRFASARGVLLALLIISPTVAFAQSCDSLPIDGSPLSYRFRTNVPRCEGMYRSPVSGEPGMSLVSLTFGKVTYDTKQDAYLEIKLPVDPTEKTPVRAVGIPERLYYRLDAELGPGRSALRLPLADVVVPENISPEEFGVFGLRMLAGGQNAFLPVIAHGAGADSDARAEVVAVVRPGADVSDVRWREYVSGTSPTAWVPVTGGSGLVPEGTRLEIVVGTAIAQRTTLDVSFLLQGVGRADRFVLMAR